MSTTLEPPKAKELDITARGGATRSARSRTWRTRQAGSGCSRKAVGARTPFSRARSATANSSAPAPPSRWPCSDFVELTGTSLAAAPNTTLIASASTTSPTAVGDVVEAEAINVVFGAAANDVPVSSTKSLHGHLLGGAGALEFAVALLALEKGVLAPTAFLEQPDPACRVRHVRLRAERVAPPRAVMSNSFAFGGSNVVLIAERA